MKKASLFPALWLLLPASLLAQPYLIDGSIQHVNRETIYLASYFGDRFNVIDSMESAGGEFRFYLPWEAPAGIYRLVYSDEYRGVRTENRFVDFIYNRTPLAFNVTLEETGPMPHFERSEENRVYFEFMTFQLQYEAGLMEAYAGLFPARPGNPEYDKAVKHYEELQTGRLRFMDSLTRVYPELYATRIMNALRVPVVSGSLDHRERIRILRDVFFQDAPMDDPSLLYAPVYTFRIVDYLSLFRDDSLSLADQEGAFKEAVDRIMVNVGTDPGLRSFLVEFMLEGFELLGMEQVQLHLADHYLDESCQSDAAEMVKERMEAYREMVVGRQAPDFVISDVEGRTRSLSDIPNPYVLVLFWSSECPHCREMIPRLHSWYLDENQVDLEVVAISLDSSLQAFSRCVEETDMQWITGFDPMGWQGKAATDYHVYATPSLFLLDAERNILARPVSFGQLRRSLRKLLPN